MNKRYLILALIAVAVGAGMLFMPESERTKEMEPEILLIDIDDPSRFLSTDLITDQLVKKDPTLFLIDVRPVDQYKAFSIPGAVSIPMDSLLSASSLDILSKNDLEKVFYSNSDLTADQAWILTKRTGVESIFVMQGGLNKWFNDIVKAEKPAETEPAEILALYQFRMAARQYFFGSSDVKPAVVATAKKTVPVQRKPAEVSSGGGC